MSARDDEALRAAVRAEVDAAVAPLRDEIARLTAELRARRRRRAPPPPIVEPAPEVRERVYAAMTGGPKPRRRRRKATT